MKYYVVVLAGSIHQELHVTTNKSRVDAFVKKHNAQMAADEENMAQYTPRCFVRELGETPRV